jgi:hypothetical protein
VAHRYPFPFLIFLRIRSRPSPSPAACLGSSVSALGKVARRARVGSQCIASSGASGPGEAAFDYTAVRADTPEFAECPILSLRHRAATRVKGLANDFLAVRWSRMRLSARFSLGGAQRPCHAHKRVVASPTRVEGSRVRIAAITDNASSRDGQRAVTDARSHRRAKEDYGVRR